MPKPTEPRLPPFLRSSMFQGELAQRVGTTDVRMIEVGSPGSGTKVAHRAIGTGPDLLFVHGWPLTSATYRNIVPALAERFTCHLIDLPGAGLSEWGPDTEIGLSAHCEALTAVVRALELREVVIVGHDSGGLFARACAAALPETVRGLVLGNTEIPRHLPLLLLPYLVVGKLPKTGRLMAAIMGNRTIRRSGLVFGACFTDFSALEEEFAAHFVAPLQSDPKLARGQARLIENLDTKAIARLAETHAAITCPVHLIWGDADRFFPAEKMRLMLEQFGGPVTVREVPGAKLFVHEEHPQMFAEEIATFALPRFSNLAQTA